MKSTRDQVIGFAFDCYVDNDGEQCYKFTEKELIKLIDNESELIKNDLLSLGDKGKKIKELESQIKFNQSIAESLKHHNLRLKNSIKAKKAE